MNHYIIYCSWCAGEVIRDEAGSYVCSKCGRIVETN